MPTENRDLASELIDAFDIYADARELARRADSAYAVGEVREELRALRDARRSELRGLLRRFMPIDTMLGLRG